MKSALGCGGGRNFCQLRVNSPVTATSAQRSVPLKLRKRSKLFRQLCTQHSPECGRGIEAVG
jgi:hypothetical protein